MKLGHLRQELKKTKGKTKTLLLNNKGYLLRKNLDIVDVISFVRVEPPGLASKNIKVPTNTVDIKKTQTASYSPMALL
ncbi:hypothetical protein N8999_01520 [Gammaproteobacteria bacterium]|nr:hypothetical protein [Gammaproteobacteria bacterium]